MRKFSGDDRYRPINAWGYLGLSILFAIPVIGLVFLIIFSLNGSNVHRRSYARSYFCGLLVLALLIFGSTRIKLNPETTTRLAKDAVVAAETIGKLAAPLIEKLDGLVREIKTEAGMEAASKGDDLKGILKECEQFFDEYVAFMEKYDAENADDQLRFTAMTEQYAEVCVKMEQLESRDLTDAERQEVQEAQARIDEKLASIMK